MDSFESMMLLCKTKKTYGTVGYHYIYMYIWRGFDANLRDPPKSVYMVVPEKVAL